MSVMDFDPKAAPEQSSGGAGPLPEGEYVAIITKAVAKDTTDRSGQYVETEFSVVAPDKYKGRKFWHNINFKNKSEKAAAIGQGQLRFLCEQFGIGRLTDPSALCGRPVGVKLKIELGNDKPGGGKYPDKNGASYFKAPGEVDFATIGATQAYSAPAQAQRTAPPAPWSSAQPPSAAPAAPTPAPAPAPAPADAPAPAPATSAGSTPPWARK